MNPLKESKVEKQQFKTQLTQLNIKPRVFSGYLYAKYNSELVETNVFRFIFEKVKGFLGFRDGTNQRFVEFKVIQLFLQNQQWIKQKQFPAMQGVAKRVTLATSRKDHAELDFLIEGIRDKTLNQDVARKLLLHFAVKHKVELKPFEDEINRILKLFENLVFIPPSPSNEGQDSGNLAGGDSHAASDGNEDPSLIDPAVENSAETETQRKVEELKTNHSKMLWKQGVRTAVYALGAIAAVAATYYAWNYMATAAEAASSSQTTSHDVTQLMCPLRNVTAIDQGVLLPTTTTFIEASKNTMSAIAQNITRVFGGSVSAINESIPLVESNNLQGFIDKTFGNETVGINETDLKELSVTLLPFNSPQVQKVAENITEKIEPILKEVNHSLQSITIAIVVSVVGFFAYQLQKMKPLKTNSKGNNLSFNDSASQGVIKKVTEEESKAKKTTSNKKKRERSSSLNGKTDIKKTDEISQPRFQLDLAKADPEKVKVVSKNIPEVNESNLDAEEVVLEVAAMEPQGPTIKDLVDLARSGDREAIIQLITIAFDTAAKDQEAAQILKSLVDQPSDAFVQTLIELVLDQTLGNVHAYAVTLVEKMPLNPLVNVVLSEETLVEQKKVAVEELIRRSNGKDVPSMDVLVGIALHAKTTESIKNSIVNTFRNLAVSSKMDYAWECLGKVSIEALQAIVLDLKINAVTRRNALNLLIKKARDENKEAGVALNTIVLNKTISLDFKITIIEAFVVLERTDEVMKSYLTNLPLDLLEEVFFKTADKDTQKRILAILNEKASHAPAVIEIITSIAIDERTPKSLTKVIIDHLKNLTSSENPTIKEAAFKALLDLGHTGNLDALALLVRMMFSVYLEDQKRQIADCLKALAVRVIDPLAVGDCNDTDEKTRIEILENIFKAIEGALDQQSINYGLDCLKNAAEKGSLEAKKMLCRLVIANRTKESEKYFSNINTYYLDVCKSTIDIKEFLTIALHLYGIDKGLTKQLYSQARNDLDENAIEILIKASFCLPDDESLKTFVEALFKTSFYLLYLKVREVCGKQGAFDANQLQSLKPLIDAPVGSAPTLALENS